MNWIKDNLVELIKTSITLAFAVMVVMLVQGCAVDPWSRQDTQLQLMDAALIAVDGHQTSGIQYRPDLVEGGPVAQRWLGNNPSTSDTWQYMISRAVFNFGVSLMLPQEWRPVWQTGTMIDTSLAIRGNCISDLRCL